MDDRSYLDTVFAQRRRGESITRNTAAVVDHSKGDEDDMAEAASVSSIGIYSLGVSVANYTMSSGDESVPEMCADVEPCPQLGDSDEARAAITHRIK